MTALTASERATRRACELVETADPRDVSEADFQTWVTTTALAAGWTLQFHVRRAQVKGRWLTNTSTAGVPDLWLVHPGWDRVVVLELKAQKGRTAPEQAEWIAALQRVPGVEAYVVRPSDRDDVRDLLTDTPDPSPPSRLLSPAHRTPTGEPTP